MALQYTLVDGKVSVVETRTVVVGARYTISSSEGMAGITSGHVDVRQVILPEDMDAKTREETVTLWTDIAMIEPEDEEYEDYMNMLCNEPWVQYEYPSYVKNILEGDEVQWLPLEIFLDHKTIY